jgi:hypothetical protein
MLSIADPAELLKTKALIGNPRCDFDLPKIFNLLNSGYLLITSAARESRAKKMSENNDRSRNVV